MMAEPTGFEPATSDVTGRRSNQLNYDSAPDANAIWLSSTGWGSKFNSSILWRKHYTGCALPCPCYCRHNVREKDRGNGPKSDWDLFLRTVLRKRRVLVYSKSFGRLV
jgi:hypothetical protein